MLFSMFFMIGLKSSFVYSFHSLSFSVNLHKVSLFVLIIKATKCKSAIFS